MKSARMLLVIVLTVVVVSLMLIQLVVGIPPDFDKSGGHLNYLGLLKGEGRGITQEYLQSGAKRWQAAIMFVRLTGNEKKISDYIPKGNFDDSNLVDQRTAKYLAFLHDHPELGMIGVGGNRMEPFGDITATEYYNLMLNVLGYVENSETIIRDFLYVDTLKFAEAKGLYRVADKNSLTVEDMCIATVEALYSNMKDENMSLAGTLYMIDVIPRFEPCIDK